MAYCFINYGRVCFSFSFYKKIRMKSNIGLTYLKNTNFKRKFPALINIAC